MQLGQPLPRTAKRLLGRDELDLAALHLLTSPLHLRHPSIFVLEAGGVPQAPEQLVGQVLPLVLGERERLLKQAVRVRHA